MIATSIYTILLGLIFILKKYHRLFLVDKKSYWQHLDKIDKKTVIQNSKTSSINSEELIIYETLIDRFPSTKEPIKQYSVCDS